MVAQTQTRVIKVKVETKGDADLKRIAAGMGKLNRETKKTSDVLGGFRNVFAGAIAGLGIREITRAADQFQLLEDRIKAFTGSAEVANKVFTLLKDSAALVKTSVNAMGQTFNRVALATQELGLTNEQMIATTVALQQTFRLSGATIAEATGATIQLTQGLSSGQLRGQELRSVLESNVIFSTMLAKELGIARGQLIKFAESGKITSDVVLNALSKNFDDLNKKAEALGTTFEQSTIIMLDAFKFKLNELNKSFGVSRGFENFSKVIVSNIGVIGAAIAGLVSFVIISAIPKMIAAMNAFAAAMAKNPIGLILVGVSTAIALMAYNWEKSLLVMEKTWVVFMMTTLKSIDSFVDKFRTAAQWFGKLAGIDVGVFKGDYSDDIDKLGNLLAEVNLEIIKLDKNSKKNEGKDLFKALSVSLKGLDLDKAKTMAGPFKTLNAQFKKGKISLEEYNQAIRQLKVDDLNKKFEAGTINLYQYNKELEKLNKTMARTGTISSGIAKGLKTVSEDAGNVAMQVAMGVENAFDNLEDMLFEFTKNGKLEFKKFAQAILDDLTRIIIRAQIVAPLAQGLVGAMTPAAASSTVTPNANGNAFSNGNIVPFANGGVVNSPTVFPFAKGIGLMGEAGPEAIMPLKRGPDGKLGVEGGGSNVVVNVINNSGNEVEQRERTGASGEKILDVLILSSVKKNIAKGELDSTLGQVYGLRRRGA